MLTAVLLRIQILWHKALSGSRRFGASWCVHLQGSLRLLMLKIKTCQAPLIQGQCHVPQDLNSELVIAMCSFCKKQHRAALNVNLEGTRFEPWAGISHSECRISPLLSLLTNAGTIPYHCTVFSHLSSKSTRYSTMWQTGADWWLGWGEGYGRRNMKGGMMRGWYYECASPQHLAGLKLQVLKHQH